MRWARPFLITLLLILSALVIKDHLTFDDPFPIAEALPSPPDEDANAIDGSGVSYHNTSWVVPDGERQIYRNQTIFLRGNLTINSTASLDLVNVTLVFNNSHNGQYGIHLMGNGFLNITDGDSDDTTSDDASNITAMAQGGRIFFIIDPHSNFRFLNSALNGCGYMPATTNTYGLTLMANGSTISGCTFSGNLVGVDCKSAQNFQIANCVFASNDGIGARFENCDNYVFTQNSAINCPTGFEVVGSDASQLSELQVSSCSGTGVRLLDSNVCILDNITSSQCGHGLLIENSAGCTIRSSLIEMCDTNLFADGSQSTTVENSTLQDPVSQDVKISNGGTVVMVNSTFDHQSTDISGSESHLLVKWHLHIQVNDTAPGQPYPPMFNASVEIRNNLNTVVLSRGTDQSGQIRWIEVTDFTRDSTQTTELNPYKVKVQRNGYNEQLSYVDIDRDTFKFFDLVLNLLPSSPTNLTPSSTHDRTPTVHWDASSDPDDTSITYSYTVGTSPGGTDILPATETSATNFTVNVPIPYNSTLNIRIYAKDPKNGQSPPVDHALQVINHRPLPPVIGLTPSSPKEEDNITCTILNLSIDPDGDSVDYSYRWYRDGVLQSKYTVSNTSALTNTLPFSATGREQRWRCEVSAADPWFQSYLSAAEVTVNNAPPVVTSPMEDITFQEDTVYTGLDLNDHFKDPDRFQSLDFETQGALMLFIDISNKGEVTINATANWFGMEAITFFADDGEVTISDTVNVTVTPVNDVPQIVPIPDIHKNQGEWLNTTISGLDLADPTDVLTFDTNITDEVPGLIPGTNYHFDNTTGALSVHALNSNIGNYVVMIKVMDDHGGSAHGSFKLTFLNVNDPPYAPTIISPTEGQDFKPEEALILKGICDDPDFHVPGSNEVLTYRWGSTINGDLGTGELLLNVVLSPGNHTLTLTVSDRFSLSQSSTVNITIGSPEQDVIEDGEDGVDDEASGLVVAMIVILVVVMLLLLLFILLILRKKRKARQEEVLIVKDTPSMGLYYEEKRREPEKIEAPDSKLELLSDDAEFDDKESAMYTGKDDIDFLMTRGHENFYKDDYTEAILQWQKALEMEPHREDIKALITKAAEKLKEARSISAPESGEDLKLEKLPEGAKRPDVQPGAPGPVEGPTQTPPPPFPETTQDSIQDTGRASEAIPPPTADVPVKSEARAKGPSDRKDELDDLFDTP